MVKKWLSSLGKSSNRIATPSVLQMEAVECGAASLSMILRYYGKYLSLDKLRMDCDVSRDGSAASNILRAARLNGLEAKGFKKEVQALYDTPMPIIIHWNFNHFLVLEGLDDEKAYLNDPAAGHRSVTIKEFGSSFTGVALTFEPSVTFEKSGKKSELIGNLKERLSPHSKAMYFILTIGFMLVIPGIVLPTFTKVFVDDILVRGADDWLWPLIAGMGITVLVKMWLEHLKLKYLLRTQSKIDLVTSSSFFWHLLSLPVNFFAQRHAGEISSRVAINSKVAMLITGRLANNFMDIVIIVFFAFVMFLFDVELTFIGIGLALINVFALRYFSKKRKEGYLRFAIESGQLSGVSMAGLQTIETIKATGRENDFFVRWSGHQTKMLNAQQKLGVLSILLGSIPRLISSFITTIILCFGAWKIMEGEMTIGMLVAFQGLMGSFVRPVENLVNLGGQLQEAEGDMARLDDITKTEEDKQVSRGNKQRETDYSIYGQKLEGYVEFKKVTFGYSRLAEPLISDFSLQIKPGERIALVGGSGSGKSTLAKLLAGLYEPQKGKILLDGVPRSKWSRQIINNSLAMVDQDIFLFEGSGREVLTLWDSTIPDQQIIKASKDACIHDTISGKKNGYDFHFIEGGKNFSGGQRQRVEIARALVGNPSILILDEATSALDPPTEKLVYDNIKRRRCSVIVVAHRLSTIRDCDEIIVLDKGQIVERGTHAELVKLKGTYYHLIKS
ncbi:MAG: NHLP family bacteriocin export ABC transporter peptidase/permease/ATPase subunit [Vicingaceae bacterium]